MGDRGNIVIQAQRGKRVYLYSHWGGHELPEILRRALRRGCDRWDDPQYLARIVFCELLGGNTNGTTGFGISSDLGDNEHPIIVVDCEQQTIYLEGEGGKSYAEPKQPRTYSIGEFAALSEANWGSLDDGRKQEAA